MPTAPAAPRIHSVDAVEAADGFAPRPRVVVVGVGHAGLEATKALAGAPLDVLVVDRHNYHTFQPLLYQVATAGLLAGNIARPARHVFRVQPNADFRLATVTGVDLEARLLLTADGDGIPYDYLILGAGASTAYFGVEGAERYAFPLKSVADAVNLRAHLLGLFEAANRNPNLLEEGALDVAVVGGGATGVEMAGALQELFDRVLARDFPSLDVARARVILVERGPDLMETYEPHLRAYTLRTLEKRGVEVRLNSAVEQVTPDAVYFKGGEGLPTRTVIWAAGVRAAPLAGALGVEQTRGGRVVVDDGLRVPGHPEVFVAGDLAGATDATGQLYPQVAQVAIQQGVHAARQIQRAIRGLEPEPFAYRDLGQMATVGRNAAILQLPSGFTLTGFFAWVGWLLVHVVNLIGFRNRAAVLLTWAYNYFTYDRGPRLILPVQPDPDSARVVPAPVPAGAADDGGVGRAPEHAVAR